MRKICQHILVCLSLGAIVLLTSCGGDQPSELKPAKPRTDSLLHGVWMAERVNYVLYDMEEIENPNSYGFDYLPDSNVWIIDMHAGRIYGWKDGKAADYFTDFQLLAPSSKTHGMYECCRRGRDSRLGTDRLTYHRAENLSSGDILTIYKARLTFNLINRNSMKKSLLTGTNAVITFLMALLGFGTTGCFMKYGAPVEYGVPHATFEAAGKVTDEAAQPVENIRVTMKTKRENEYLSDQYTNEDGEYYVSLEDNWPIDSVDIIVTDTADVYEGDSVRVKVDYDRSGVSKGDNWNNGKGIVRQDFQLKKK